RWKSIRKKAIVILLDCYSVPSPDLDRHGSREQIDGERPLRPADDQVQILVEEPIVQTAVDALHQTFVLALDGCEPQACTDSALHAETAHYIQLSGAPDCQLCQESQNVSTLSATGRVFAYGLRFHLSVGVLNGLRESSSSPGAGGATVAVLP